MTTKISFQRVALATLAIVALALGVYVKILEKMVENTQDHQYILPPGVLNRVVMKNRTVVVYKKIQGKTIIQKVYVPQEGNVNVVVSTNTGKPEVKTTFRTAGVTARPGIGAVYETNSLLATLDVKIFYWSRASAGVGLTTHSLNGWGSYHLDWVPFWHPQNLEATAGYSILRFDGKPNRFNLGFRVNF